MTTKTNFRDTGSARSAHRWLALALSAIGLLVSASAQLGEVPFMGETEQRTLDSQSADFSAAVKPLLTKAAESTVRVWSGRRRLAYGTVVGDGTNVLTKWSEIARAGRALQIDSTAGTRSAEIIKVFEDEDLALLKIDGAPLPAVKWAQPKLPLGSLLIAAQPDGDAAGIGVVSVLPRNLRQTDRAFLGVAPATHYDGPGVKIGTVEPESGAAEADLQPGDVILTVEDRTISGLLELQNALTGRQPGETVKLEVLSGNTNREVLVQLGNRPELPQFTGSRLTQMERMGGPISRVGDGFSSALQTDMRQLPNQIGGPVVNLDGEIIGITAARAGRTRSYVIPAEKIIEILAGDGTTPELANLRSQNSGQEVANADDSPRHRPQSNANPDRLRRHMSDTDRLRDLLTDELERLGER